MRCALYSAYSVPWRSASISWLWLLPPRNAIVGNVVAAVRNGASSRGNSSTFRKVITLSNGPSVYSWSCECWSVTPRVLIGSLAGVAGLAVQGHVLAQGLRPQLRIPVRHQLQAVGIRHHDGHVRALVRTASIISPASSSAGFLNTSSVLQRSSISRRAGQQSRGCRCRRPPPRPGPQGTARRSVRPRRRECRRS